MENTVKKENWLTQKWRQFKEWKRKTDLKIDYWSRKKPLRRKLYLNRTLYLMMLPYVLLFTAFTKKVKEIDINNEIFMPIINVNENYKKCNVEMLTDMIHAIKGVILVEEL